MTVNEVAKDVEDFYKGIHGKTFKPIKEGEVSEGRG
jgi:hypothetical protein